MGVCMFVMCVRLYGDCVTLRNCLHVCECVTLSCGCVVFVCVFGHVCMVIVAVCINVCTFVAVCACMANVLCLYVFLVMIVW